AVGVGGGEIDVGQPLAQRGLQPAAPVQRHRRVGVAQHLAVGLDALQADREILVEALVAAAVGGGEAGGAGGLWVLPRQRLGGGGVGGGGGRHGVGKRGGLRQEQVVEVAQPQAGEVVGGGVDALAVGVDQGGQRPGVQGEELLFLRVARQRPRHVRLGPGEHQ